MKVDDFDKSEHAIFVANYFKLNMNQTRAYLATYGEDLDYMGAAASANRLLKNAKVSAAIKKELQDRIMQADEVLARVSEFGRSEHGQYLKKDGTLDIEKLIADGKGHLIKGIKKTKYGTVYEFHDPGKYLELQGKYHTLWKDKLEIEQSPLESEVLQLLKNGDVTADQVLKTLGDNDRTRQLIASIK